MGLRIGMGSAMLLFAVSAAALLPSHTAAACTDDADCEVKRSLFACRPLALRFNFLTSPLLLRS